jgi:hypothetical protein
MGKDSHARTSTTGCLTALVVFAYASKPLRRQVCPAGGPYVRAEARDHGYPQLGGRHKERRVTGSALLYWGARHGEDIAVEIHERHAARQKLALRLL